MKKSYLLIIIWSLITILSVQQANAQVDFGLRAGVNFANYNDIPDYADSNARIGLMAGAYLDINLPISSFSIQPEVLYTQKGHTLRTDYLEIPLLAKFSFTPGTINPHIYVGPYTAFFLNRERNNLPVVNNPQTDFGGIVGAGTDINAGGTTLNMGFRYGFGLVDAYENSRGKNSVFSIIAGVSL